MVPYGVCYMSSGLSLSIGHGIRSAQNDTSTGAASRRGDKVACDAVRRCQADVDELAIRRPQLQPRRVEVEVAPLQSIPLLLPVQHPLQPLQEAKLFTTAHCM